MLLGSEFPSRDHVNSYNVKSGNLVSTVQQKDLCKQVTKEEIKNAMWSIGGDKAPSPDGHSSQFYKDNWAIVEEDVVEAIPNFFVSGKLLK